MFQAVVRFHYTINIIPRKHYNAMYNIFIFNHHCQKIFFKRIKKQTQLNKMYAKHSILFK